MGLADRYLTAAAAIAAAAALAAAPQSVRASSCPNEALRAARAITYLADCRAYELVSPAEKNEEEVVDPGYVIPRGLAFRAAAQGSAIMFGATGGLPGAQSAGQVSQYLATLQPPEPSGWSVLSLNPESRFATSREESTGSPGTLEYLSPQAGCGVMNSQLPLARHAGEEQPDLPPGESGSENPHNLYVWSRAAGGAPESNTLVTEDRPEGQQSEEPVFVTDGASEGCSHVTFESELGLLGDPAGSLFEWSEAGHVSLASVLPDGLPALHVRPIEAGSGTSSVGETSSDGSKVFFDAIAEGGPASGRQGEERFLEQVYVRENGDATVQVSESATAVPDRGARLQAASASGAEVLFTANYGLTQLTSQGSAAAGTCNAAGAGCDLYSYDTEDGTLTDLTPDVEARSGDSAGAEVWSVLGVSSDASVVYFSAAGRLAEGAPSEQQDLAEGLASIYAYHDGATTFIASVGAGEVGAGGAQEGVDAIAQRSGTMEESVSRSTADGGRLLFATRRQLGSYNNLQEGGTEREWEEYEYTLASGSLLCASCDPSGARPRRADHLSEFGTLGPFVQSYDGALSRTLSEDGRVFFDTSDPIAVEGAARASNGTTNAYEFRPQGVSGCQPAQGCVTLLDSGTDPFPSYMEEASASGQDVYVTTDAQLAPQDTDGLRDIYDVREDGGVAVQPTPTLCEGEGCQPAGYTPLASVHAQSETPAARSGLGGVLSYESVRLALHRHSTRGSTLTIILTAPVAGRLTVSGPGLNTVRRILPRLGTYAVRATLRVRGRAAVRGRRRIRVRVAYSPEFGSGSSVYLTVSFR